MRISNFIILFVIIIFLNCAGYWPWGVIGMAHHKNWKAIENTVLSLLNTPEDKIAISPKQVISFCNITEIEYDNSISSNIDTLDPVIMFDKHDSVLSNYEVYKFYGEKNKKIKVELNSYFHTWGFGWYKFAMIPYIYLIDSNNEIIFNEPIKMKFTEPFIGNWYILCEWIYDLKLANDYYLIVASDNRFVGQRVGKIHAIVTSTYTTSQIDLPLYASPIGKYKIKTSIL